MNPDGKCDFCDNDLAAWDYRYRGKHYCRRCYELNFRLKTCAICSRKKRVHRELKIPVCKICQVRDRPCIRCKREIKHFGMITEHGPVCTPCSKYFREPKRCPVCGEESREVFRHDIDGERSEICRKCYDKRLLTCVLCQRKKKTYRMDERGRSVCKACATTARRCGKCGKEIPGGRGRICIECAARNGLARKKRFGMGALPKRTAEAFETFTDWFERKRGPQVASLRLLEYLPFFMDIGSLEERLGRFPRYRELANVLSVKRMWENRLAMEFLDGSGLVEKDGKVQKEIAEQDMIKKCLHIFSGKSFFGKVLTAYYEKLEAKMLAGKTTVRSMRLALTPAKRFLEYCSYCRKERPDQESLEGYLWIYPGQKNALTGFVHFVSEWYGLGLKISEIKKPVLSPPTGSKRYLEQRFIEMLRKNDLFEKTGKDELLRVAVGYLHWLEIPQNIHLGFVTIKNTTMRFAGHNFFLPTEVTKICNRNVGY